MIWPKHMEGIFRSQVSPPFVCCWILWNLQDSLKAAKATCYHCSLHHLLVQQQVGWSTTLAPPLLNLSALVLVEPVHWWRGLVEGSAKRSQSCPAVIWPLLVFPVRLSAPHWQPGNCGTSATMLLLSWSLVNLVQTLHCAGPVCS